MRSACKLAADAEATFKAIEAEERKILSEAREQASAQLMQLRERLARQAAEARPALASEAQTLAGQMLERVHRESRRMTRRLPTALVVVALLRPGRAGQ